MGVAGRDFLCRRQGDKAVVISIEADEAIIEDAKLELPAIVKYSPPPPKEAIDIPYCQPSEAISVQCGGSVDYGNVIWNGTTIQRPNLVSYSFNAKVGGTYDLCIRYGSREPRGVQIDINPDTERAQTIQDALGAANACWTQVVHTEK